MSSTSKTNQKNKKHKKLANFVEALVGVDGKRSAPQERVETPPVENFAKLRRHQEVISTSVFDREKEEVEKRIEEIQDELKKLAKELAQVGAAIDKAIKENIANPGTYHITFFEALRRYLIQLRKKASESKNWLAISMQRKAQQSKMGQAMKQSNTKVFMSNESVIARSTG